MTKLKRKDRDMLFLATPSEKYKDSYIQGIKELQAEGRQMHVAVKSISKDFARHIQRLLDQANPSKLKSGYVAASEYWLIDGDEWVGRLSLRHELNEFLLKIAGHIGYEIRPSKRRRGYGKEILRLGLEKARELGLRRVLVTCDEDNIGSKKIIEANGGQLENVVEVEGERVRKLRYWIDIK
jgi:predicted acetyltransferase